MKTSHTVLIRYNPTELIAFSILIQPLNAILVPKLNTQD